MIPTYESHIEKPISEKSLISWIEPAERLMAWSLHSGSVYKKTVNHFLIELIQEGIKMERVSSLSEVTSEGKYYFDDQNKIVYANSFLDVDPEDVFTVAFYRIGFSNFPFIGQIDDNGREIEYFPIISNNPNFRHELDHQNQSGVALSSDSSISFLLEDFFIQYYDRLEWKNKRIKVWSYSPDLPFSEKKLYFDGIVDEKRYSDQEVAFSVKDFISKLDESVPLELYSNSDGEIPESRIGKPKRRIYGRVSGLNVISLNQVLDGFEIQGQWSGTIGSNLINGVGGNITDFLSPEDKVILVDDDDVEFKVDKILSDNQIQVSEEIQKPFLLKALKVKPQIQSLRTGRNTEYLISSGHALKEASAQIVRPIQFNRFEVDDAQDMLADDLITINGVSRFIRRVSVGNIITLTQSLNVEPSPGDVVTRNPVQKVYANGNSFIVDRDYTVLNDSSGSKLIFNELAEFNVALATRLAGNISFTNGSNEVLLSGIEIKANFKPRDWVKPLDPDFFDWYEILEVDEDNSKLILRSTYNDLSFSGQGLIKRIDPIGDNTKVTIECFGKTFDNTKNGDFIYTGSDVVKDVLTEIGIDNLNDESFDLADETAPQLISLALPIDLDSTAPKVSDVIEIINKSIFGSLHYNNDFEIEYNVLTAEKPEITPDFIIKDDDILDWSVSSSGKNIIQKVIGRFKHQDADRFTGNPSFSVSEYENEYVKRVVQDNETQTFDFYLWNRNDCQTMVERMAFMNEISQSVIKIIGKLHLGKFKINDKILLSLDRIYARFGSVEGLDMRKICIVSAISKNEDTIELTLDDLGNIWNRTANITKDNAVDFALASSERIINGYITDNNDLISDDQDTYRLNLIG